MAVAQPQAIGSDSLLTDGLLALLTGRGRQLFLTPGEVLLPAGESPRAVWVVVNGSVRSLATLPPQNDWRTVERHPSGTLVGWLGLMYGRPLEHLRAGELCELLEVPAAVFHDLWNQESELRQWCAEQAPNLEAVSLPFRALNHAGVPCWVFMAFLQCEKNLMCREL